MRLYLFRVVEGFIKSTVLFSFLNEKWGVEHKRVFVQEYTKKENLTLESEKMY